MLSPFKGQADSWNIKLLAPLAAHARGYFSCAVDNHHAPRVSFLCLVVFVQDFDRHRRRVRSERIFKSKLCAGVQICLRPTTQSRVSFPPFKCSSKEREVGFSPPCFWAIANFWRYFFDAIPSQADHMALLSNLSIWLQLGTLSRCPSFSWPIFTSCVGGIRLVCATTENCL